VSAGRRANGEGSIYPYRDGMFAAYVWVSTPDGKRRRKSVYGATRELVHTKWLELHRVAAVGPVSTTTPTLSEYMTYWLNVRAVLRSALSNAMAEELITRNVATGIKMPRLRTRTIQPWSVEEARRFLESARDERDPFYPAYVLILVLGLRRGEMLGLTWPMVNLDTAEVEIRYGLQRIGGRLVHGETKTQASDALLPLPDICSTALRLQEKSQSEAKAAAGPFWVSSGYVFSTRDGFPSTRATSTEPSRPAATRQVSDRCRCMAHGTPAGHCWPPWTSTLAWPCRSSGTARSR